MVAPAVVVGASVPLAAVATFEHRLTNDDQLGIAAMSEGHVQMMETLLVHAQQCRLALLSSW